MTLGPIIPDRKTGDEPLHADGAAIGPTLLDFWQWSGSDLVGNALRGVLAEYLVARALGTVRGVRTEWDAYDLVTESGIKIEVKASGFIQSWQQKRLSRIGFDIAPKRGWDAVRNEYATQAGRAADVYVFAVHCHTDQATIDPLNVGQWEFYVLATGVLDQRCAIQRRISLASLRRLCPGSVAFDGLAAAVATAANC